MLVVRLSGSTVPKSWNRWGHPLSPNALRVWTFPLPPTMDLADLVEALMIETPSHLHGQCLAVWINPDFDGRLPFSVLDELEPLGVMHARLHEPWIMRDLGDLVRTRFQAIVKLQDKGELLGYQTLCALEHPERGRITDHELFHIARLAQRTDEVEQTCQISALLRKAESLPRGVPTFVSAHPQTLLTYDLRRHPSYACVERLALDPHDIVIELVGYSRLDDLDLLVHNCQELRQMGFRIALGDVGAGLSQVGLMIGVEPEFACLDGALLRAARHSTAGQMLLAGLVETAHRLGTACIAEGIEDSVDLQICRNLAIAYGQGAMIGPVAPVPLVPNLLPPDTPFGKRTASG